MHHYGLHQIYATLSYFFDDFTDHKLHGRILNCYMAVYGYFSIDIGTLLVTKLCFISAVSGASYDLPIMVQGVV